MPKLLTAVHATDGILFLGYDIKVVVNSTPPHRKRK
jgi:hypothetical protein